MDAQTTYDLELSIVIAAQPTTIYRFFEDPERFSDWLSARVSFEPRPGSAIRIDFPADGSPDCPEGTVMGGEVVEVRDGRHFAFTWGHRGGPREAEMPPGSSRVDITLTPDDDGTRVTLRHSGLPTEEQRELHVPGWRHYLCQLSVKSTQLQLGDAARETIDAWFAAWCETDAHARATLLEKSWHANGRFQDDFAYAEGREALSEHIGMAQTHMSGMILQAAGPIQLCHSNVRFGWRMTDPQGNAVFTGSHFGELAPDGRLTRLVGFADDSPAM